MPTYRLRRFRDACYDLLGRGIAAAGFSARLYRPQLVRFAAVSDRTRLVVVVCKGNICRSPYAEARIQAALHQAHIEGIEVRSAGLEAGTGKPAEAAAIRAAAARGVDLRAHRSAPLTPELLSQTDLIVLMEPNQLRDLRRLEGFSSKTDTVLMGALTLEGGYPLVVRDPFGRSDDCFSHCFSQIDSGAERLVGELRASLGTKKGMQ
ncbi:MAG: hypothetical protein KDD69_13260 [Bdellovibrionales bacterium]|nr:hypothetical protein [Bdellovibrionales bacterium]